jgi:hypothetical protein
VGNRSECVSFDLESFWKFFDYSIQLSPQLGPVSGMARHSEYQKIEWSRSMGNWINALEFNAAWFFPIASLVGLWLCRTSPDQLIRTWSERVFFAMLLLLAGITLRTIAANEQAWLLHTTSLGIMIIGGVIPSNGDSSETFDEVPLTP